MYDRITKWWWRGLWKLHCPTKNKLLWWSILEDNISTWDNLQKRSFEGPGWCVLCKNALESGPHLFLQCPTVQKVWQEALHMLRARADWSGPSLEEAFKCWWNAEYSKSFQMIPLIISWGIWIARNNLIFNDKGCSEVEIATKAVGLILFFLDADHPPCVTEVTVESINSEIPWGFFDGAAGGEPTRCGGGIILHLDAHNSVHYKAGFKHGSF